MEMLDGGRRLIGVWETSGMEEDSCCCCCCCTEKAGLHGQTALIQALRQKQTRLQRVLAVALLLLISAAVALVVVFAGPRSAERQPMMPPVIHSSGVSAPQQQQRNFQENPSAMLTVPVGKYSNGKYLEWESVIGKAYCHGGFSYYNGTLVVPRGGIYRVFLQITYEGNCTRGELRLSNKVCFLSPDTYNKCVSLLSSVDTVSCRMGLWSKSLYTAGLFVLAANGKLHVTSSYRELIAKNEHQVFFGAEFVSDI